MDLIDRRLGGDLEGRNRPPQIIGDRGAQRDEAHGPPFDLGVLDVQRSVAIKGRRQALLDAGAPLASETLGLREPRRGDTVVIKRGSLGSYLMKIDGQRGLKAKRVG